ncbi:expressed unknown protein [Seminavis robusta]|uniref:Uncharacterized protein n=1 Tax=Seminavis robusta TaxID=568900 RepID=A0A9N8DTM2_9STRA|nr:expressed unknown protein [Seminavis robusta]|eukprot:Sro347_g123040.1 n/a (435) ;mRNA; r:58237-59718
MASGNRLAQLKETLKLMEDFQLPEDIQAAFSSESLNPELLRRYNTARDEYLRRRIQEEFLDYMETFDGDTILEIPELPTEEQQAELDKTLQELQTDLNQAAQAIHQQALELQQKHETFCLQREELRKMEESAKIEADAEKTEAQVKEMLGGQEPPSPTALQAETEETNKTLAEFQKMQDFYDGLRLMMEELTGIQLVKTTTTTAKESDDSDEGAATPPSVIFHVRLLQKHDVSVTLCPDPNKPEELRVKSAKFLTSTEVYAPKEAGKDQKDENKENALKLTIPNLEDLVKLSAIFPAGDDLRFVIRETMARVRVTEAQVVELAELDKFVLTRIEKPCGLEQPLVCSLNEECITVVLRLSPDCPIVPGSVYIHHMVGLGWDDDKVELVKANVSKKLFQRPIAVIQGVKAEIARLREEEGLTVPSTPVLPLRKKNN